MGRQRDRFDVARLTERAVEDSRGADPSLLDGYLELLATVAAERRRLRRQELESRRAVGVTAAEAGVPLGRVVDLYLSATWVAWRHLPRPTGTDTDDVATTVFRAANDAIVALADGYEGAQRMAIRYEEASRREFIDDLLHGVQDETRLPERAARFGLQLAGAHMVAVARTQLAFADADRATRQVGTQLRERFGARDLLISTKEGQLVCVVPGHQPEAATEFVEQCQALTATISCQVGIGRPYPGPAGVARSYKEACDVLDLAARLAITTPVLHAADLLVFQVLIRDRAAMVDLVNTVLGPLQDQRLGARPLLDTLTAYFSQGTAVAAARHLGVATRTVTYRLQRIQTLTGLTPTDPAHRFTLEAAVLGARLLGFPSNVG